MASQRYDQANNERRVKKLETANAEAMNQLNHLQAEKETFDREMRDRDTRLLMYRNEIDNLKERLEETELQRAALARELEDLGSNRDDAGKSMIDLEQANYQLNQQLKEARQQLEELEDEVSTVTMEKQRTEVSLILEFPFGSSITLRRFQVYNQLHTSQIVQPQFENA